MSPVHSEFNFHDSQLADFSVGPRREVALHIVLDPVWNEKKEKRVVVRFGAIENMSEVVAYFERLQKPADAGLFVAEVERFVVARSAATLELASVGMLQIQSKKVVIE
jgi:hypothetical protein